MQYPGQFESVLGMDYSDFLRKKNLQTFFFGILVLLSLLATGLPSHAAVVEFNTAGGTSATNGLHFYIEDTTHMQVRRLDNSGQVYSPGAVPPSTSLDNGVFLRANGVVYGPSHAVSTFTPPMYSTRSIAATSPANPSSSGIQQISTNNVGIAAGPQLSIVWKYTTPLDFLTADVTLTIPAGYAVSAANPVRYLHAFDTYLGGADQGCGIKYTDTNGKLVVGTYKPTVAGTCPSSTGLPAGATIVESFRERSGKTFSSYCANTWSTFWSGSSCSVLQSAALSNTITTTYIDTGIGVAFDFTATGTYTFSYDFVIGSTVVPAYDHIEIQHDGTGTLCPETVKVLACTSAGVPCALADIVNTGTITGNLTVAPAAPAVTVTPASFSIGSAGSIASLVLQGSGAGSYTLSSSGISGTPPLNGTKCWNGTTASCTLTIANTPCVANFECMESSVTPYINLTTTPAGRNPLYTKLVGTDFKFDVVALQASGATATAYTGTNVKVELFDDSAAPAPACSAYAAPVASQLISFVAADLGRKTLATYIKLTKAYRKLRCRATDTTLVPAVSGCSSDDFSVRPTAITSVSSSTATADSTGVSTVLSPVIKAGMPFDLTANAATAGYDGVPKINTNLLEWVSAGLPLAGGRPAPSTGTLTGLFTTAATSASGNGATGNAFGYNDVGYFRFQAQGVYDDSFTVNSSDVANNDCTNDASNVLVGGKYGCKFGNTAVTPYFGRFIPHHFTLASSSLSDPASTPSVCVAAGLIYMDQPFSLNANIEADSAAGTKTLNYSGVFGKGSVTAQMENANSGVPVALARLGVVTPVPAWAGGSYAFIANKFTRLTVADGPYDALAIGVVVLDEGGSVLMINRDMDATNASCTTDLPNTSSGTCPAITLSTTKMRHGRLKLSSIHGSERLNLPVPMKLEYWNGAGWATNTLDTCSIVAANNFSLNFPAGTAGKPNNLAACETALSIAGVTPAQKLNLSAPGTGNNGWTDVTLNLAGASGNQCVAVGAAGAVPVSVNAPWLQFHWVGPGIGWQNPAARATFGIYKNANEFIYLRELH